MAKRFLVFGGNGYYPDGGWQDFRYSFDDLNHAIEFCKLLYGTRVYHDDGPYGKYDWFQIADLEKSKIVKEIYNEQSLKELKSA